VNFLVTCHNFIHKMYWLQFQVMGQRSRTMGLTLTFSCEHNISWIPLYILIIFSVSIMTKLHENPDTGWKTQWVWVRNDTYHTSAKHECDMYPSSPKRIESFILYQGLNVVLFLSFTQAILVILFLGRWNTFSRKDILKWNYLPSAKSLFPLQIFQVHFLLYCRQI